MDEETTASAWTTISRHKKQRNMSGSTISIVQPSRQLAPGVTLESIAKQYKIQQTLWLRSSARASVLQILTRLKPDDGWAIKKAVCLGYGSFTAMRQDRNQRTMMQVAVFLDMIKCLESAGSEKIELFAQEVKPLDMDKEYLVSMGFRVIEKGTFDDQIGPAEAHFGAQTFVCDLFLEHSLETYSAIMDKENRLVMSTAGMWLDLGYARRVKSATLETKQALKDRVESKYRSYKFPMFNEATLAMEGLSIFGPAPQEDD